MIQAIRIQGSVQPYRVYQPASPAVSYRFSGEPSPETPKAPEPPPSPWPKGMLWTIALVAAFIAGFHAKEGVDNRQSINPPEPVALKPADSQQAEPDVETVSVPKLREAYPPIKPYKTHRIQVSPIHNLYVEESGNPNGYPVFYLHGGPGAGLSDKYRQFFDPKFYRIIGFDQRGCGQSTPYGELEGNTTPELIGDIDKICEELGITGKYGVFGGSWGSTYGLALAEARSERVGFLILRGISLAEPKQSAWSSTPDEGLANLIPELGDVIGRPIQGIPYDPADIAAGRDPILGIYYRLFTDPNIPETQLLEAVRDWSWAESMLSGATLKDLEAEDKPLEAYREELPMARLVCHYYYHNAFFKTGDQLIQNVEKLRNVGPITIVNGSQDYHTPPIRAHKLHQALEKAGIPATLKIIAGAGHSGWHPKTAHELISALERFKESVKQTSPTQPPETTLAE